MNSMDILTRLNEAKTDEEREWLSLQFNMESVSETIRNAVWTAAIPHWFDYTYISLC